MATRHRMGASAPTLPLDVLFAALPSLPRRILSRLTACLIERLDEMDGDPDLEPEDDRCLAGDDGVFAGAAYPNAPGYSARYGYGMDEDCERSQA